MMSINVKDWHLSIIVGGFLIFLLLMIGFDGRYYYEVNQKYLYGDWLINYQGGFVRRGFLGEIVYILSKYLDIHPKTIIYVLHLTCYAAFFCGAFYVMRKQQSFVAYIPFIFSPVLFQFQLNDPGGGFRKEILFFSVLSLSICFKYLYQGRFYSLVFLGLLAFYPVLILTHEMLAILYPVLLCMHKTLVLAKFRAVLTFTLLNIAVTLLVLLYKGNAEHVIAICESLKDFCSENIDDNGAISWLAKDSMDALKATYSRYFRLDRMPEVLMSFMIILPPLLICRKMILNTFTDRYILFLFGCTLMGTMFLSFIAIDWGRLLYVLFVSVYFVLLSNHSVKDKSEFKSERLNIVVLIGFFGYGFGGMLAHIPREDVASRYVGYIMTVVGT